MLRECILLVGVHVEQTSRRSHNRAKQSQSYGAIAVLISKATRAFMDRKKAETGELDMGVK